MEVLTLDNKDDNDSDDDSIVTTYQYLQLNFSKSMRTTKLHTYIVLIVTGLTCSVFNYEKMLINVKKSNNMLRAVINDKHQDSNLVSNLPCLFQIWFNLKSIINILAWSNAMKRFCITVDTIK